MLHQVRWEFTVFFLNWYSLLTLLLGSLFVFPKTIISSCSISSFCLDKLKAKFWNWLNKSLLFPIEFEQTPGDGEGQESLACCCPWGCKSQSWPSDWTTTTPESLASVLHHYSLWDAHQLFIFKPTTYETTRKPLSSNILHNYFFLIHQIHQYFLFFARL